MGTLLSDAWPFLLPGRLPILALLHAPLPGRRARVAWALALGAIALFAGLVLALLPWRLARRRNAAAA